MDLDIETTSKKKLKKNRKKKVKNLWWGFQDQANLAHSRMDLLKKKKKRGLVDLINFNEEPFILK